MQREGKETHIRVETWPVFPQLEDESPDRYVLSEEGGEVKKMKFRMFRFRKRSEDRLLNRIVEKYGRLFYGNWSRKSQMQGCAPLPRGRQVQ